MGGIDDLIVQQVTGLARRSWTFDWLVLQVFQMDTFKMTPLIALLVWGWFAGPPGGGRRRAVLDGLVGGFVALVATRTIQNLSPHKPRPAMSGRFTFDAPGSNMSNDWSSFPSDTAGLAFAIAYAIWRCSRPAGVFAFLWAAVVVSFPRLYGGWHYPSDLLAGALIGLACAWLAARPNPASDWLSRVVIGLSTRYAPVFYATAFVAAFQMSTYFDDMRKLGSSSLQAIGIVRQAETASPPPPHP